MRYVPILCTSLALIAGCATADKAPDAKAADSRPSGHEQTLVEVRATVTGVDQPRRLLALRADDGETTVLPIAEGFRDFEKLRAGDAVLVSLTEAVAWRVKPADQGAPGLGVRETLSNAKAGEAPGGAIETAITITATIAAIDEARGTVTLESTEGRRQTLKVKDASDLEHVRAGDLVEITYTEVRALAVRPADKKQAP